MKLIVTIDTEEDNWLPYSRNGYSTNNIEQLPRLQRLFAKLGVRATYLVTYQVATNARAADILKGLLDTGGCEVGTHCHPWSTPPFTESPALENSMLCNLEPELQEEKIRNVHEAIKARLGVTPTAFRSGRWGYSRAVAKTLFALGYDVDSSIIAYTDWRPYSGPDFSLISPKPFRFTPRDIYREDPAGTMLQVPATVGYLQRNFDTSNAIFNRIRHGSLRHLKLAGALDLLRLLNKVVLSPENASAQRMIDLARRMQANGYPLLTMYFHSSTLTAGLTPFVRSKEEAQGVLARIQTFLEFTRESGIESISLSEAARLFPVAGERPLAAAVG